jgi:hypothetical protein
MKASLAKLARLSVAEYRALGGQMGNKFGAKAIVVHGHRFASRLEADRYLHWHNLWQLKQIHFFLRQVPFELPGGITYRCDFFVVTEGLVFEQKAGRAPRNIVIEDCKGHMTRVSINKIKQVEEIYGVKVDIITRKDVRK